MHYFTYMCHYFAYHLIFIILVFIGVTRFPRVHPWPLYALGLVIQLLADTRYSGKGIVGCMLYLVMLAAVFAWIIRFRTFSGKT